MYAVCLGQHISWSKLAAMLCDSAAAAAVVVVVVVVLRAHEQYRFP